MSGLTLLSVTFVLTALSAAKCVLTCEYSDFAVSSCWFNNSKGNFVLHRSHVQLVIFEDMILQ